MTHELPDAEALFAQLKSTMAASIAHNAKLVGVYSGGAWLADRLVKELDGEHEVGYIDVSFYRDDLSTSGLKSNVRSTQIPFSVEGAHIVIVDDVLFTGRSIRAAINTLFDFGRPASVQLAVLVDRGGRELPISADFVGAPLIVAADLMLALNKDAAGKFSLATEPWKSR
ncbi:MAG: bifunctional pyr operon transcriptional regulator/uracil phosphoribosyltransferase PyrR [Betaproteobacteria bacterium]|nr:MAG: bifunctional pyr operon transcriptional regulator/uracil phosphoribosyltransferase PyrR [Betaproteobacteria bacterium]TAG46905.1 MAG: bifunctional pyr operon transcriptional regulator/uracil phosphoribosyltransferase PyrR [Betaproteobacteria bacterium]TAG83562.1 MAG: bifunctional pyr operon transcriptional regulator/uracil phosphoribosyltransferase PyrR [Betaproteobacteria bacterium]